jgi:homoaconitase/3-isopropylmalate dehydratase large subunit/3-isopropylmalate dehydratase small subunit
MSIDLQKIEVAKRPAHLRFEGRVLYLLDDADLMRRQLEGTDLDLTPELKAKLRDQISTDEITPAYICYYFDETLGLFPYLGLRASGEFPVTRGSVKAGGFVCSVSGKRRGKGSSREQSPYAELMAGIRVVIAENIERIYNENCQNLGVLTSTDFSLIDRIRAGEEIPLAAFTADVDPITREIIEYGGLFEYNVARLQGKVAIPPLGSQHERHGGDAPDVHDAEDVQQKRGAGENESALPAWTPEMQAEQTVATSQPSNRSEAEVGDGPVDAAARGANESPGKAISGNGAAHAATRARPMTIAEKIFASRWVVDAARQQFGVPWVQPGDSGFVRTDLRFSHEYVSPMAAIFFEQKLGADAKVTDPSSILMFRDHLTYLHEVMPPERVQLGLLDVARQLEVKQREFAGKQGIKLYGERVGARLGSEAICHSKVLESYAEPGMMIVGTDSHTPHSGAVGCIAFGVGTTAIFNSWITKDVRVSVPPSFKVVIRGQKPTNVTAKDFMLEILRHPYIKDGHAIGQIIEYAGDAVEALSVDERATMTNMAAEVGAFTGIIAPDARTVDYLVAERGMDRGRAEQLCAGLASDPDAEYVKVIEIDASAIQPMVALPGDPGNGLYIDELGEDPVRIEVAYAGSCTAGKKEDMDMYAAVLQAARDQGLAVHTDVKMFIQCGSQEVRQYCDERGYLALFETMGAEFIEPGCGACIAAGPGTSRRPDEVTISSQNRNFPGRSGPGQLYLASPYTVAASAVAGYITDWTPGVAIRALEPVG